MNISKNFPPKFQPQCNLNMLRIKSIHPSFIKDKSRRLQHSIHRQAEQTTQDWQRESWPLEVLTVEEDKGSEIRTTGSLLDSPAPHGYLFKCSSFLSTSVSRLLIKWSAGEGSTQEGSDEGRWNAVVAAISVAEAVVVNRA